MHAQEILLLSNNSVIYQNGAYLLQLQKKNIKSLQKPILKLPTLARRFRTEIIYYWEMNSNVNSEKLSELSMPNQKM